METFNTRVLSFIKNIKPNCYAGEEEKDALIYMAKIYIIDEYKKGNKEQREYLERCHTKEFLTSTN